MSNKLEYLRKRAGLSYRELEEKTGITYSHLSKVERGEKALTPKMAIELSSFYGTSVDYLIGVSLSERLDKFVNDLEKDYSKISIYKNDDVSFNPDYTDLTPEEILKIQSIYYINKLDKERLKKILLLMIKEYNEQYQEQIAKELNEL